MEESSACATRAVYRAGIWWLLVGMHTGVSREVYVGTPPGARYPGTDRVGLLPGQAAD